MRVCDGVVLGGFVGMPRLGYGDQGRKEIDQFAVSTWVLTIIDERTLGLRIDKNSDASQHHPQMRELGVWIQLLPLEPSVKVPTCGVVVDRTDDVNAAVVASSILERALQHPHAPENRGSVRPQVDGELVRSQNVLGVLDPERLFTLLTDCRPSISDTGR